MRTAATFTGTMLGRKFETDNGDLYTLLSVEDDRELQKRFPGFAKAVVDGLMLIDSQRLNSSRITYFNYRVQVWAEGGFDVDPTPPIRIVPANTLMDPAGPVSFPYPPVVLPPVLMKGEWDEIETMRREIVMRGGDELFVASWLDKVPAEHLSAMSSLVVDVAEKYLGKHATTHNLEAIINELYRGVIAYLVKR